MSEPIEPIRQKMTEAMPQTPEQESAAPEPTAEHEHEHLKAGMKEHNASVHPETKDRMVDIGRGQETKGRGSQ